MSGSIDAELRDLAGRAGIEVEWYDFAGRHHLVSPEVLRRILAAMDLPSATAGDMALSRRLLDRPASLQTLPPLVTAVACQPTYLNCGTAATLSAKLELEGGGARELALTPVDGRLCVPAIEQLGYHRLLLGERAITLAVTPVHGYRLNDVAPEPRLWGLSVQVYGLSRPGDGGIGDAASIAALAEAAARHGADALGLSPLHALFAAQPDRFGPYAPSSRLFLSPLHATPAMVLGEAAVAQAIGSAGLGETFARLEKLKLVDWPAAAAAKLALLSALFDGWEAGAEEGLRADLARFTAEGGALLTEHATFEALHGEQTTAGHPDWRRWPAALRDPASGEVAAFSASHRRTISFHIFMQWLADRSLRAAQLRARQAGMRIGLIGDLAVGMDPTGSHAWSRRHDVLTGLSVGAPPDLFNQQGQEWGLTSFSPRALVDGGFAPFLATVRAVLRYAGGVRIDHAMGLVRLWLVPHGASPGEGAYLAYPLTDMLRLLALESQRHQAIVIGEDLGTVPEGFRDAWRAAGAHGMRVLWFERDASGFIEPGRWDPTAVAMTSTHDLPTVAGWWRGSDITTRAACGRLGEGQTESLLQADRQEDRGALWRAFVQAGVATGELPPPLDTDQVADAAVEFVASTISPLCLLPVEDALGQEEQPNLPGTIDEHPNWRRRLPAPPEAMFDAPRVDARLRKLARLRPR